MDVLDISLTQVLVIAACVSPIILVMFFVAISLGDKDTTDEGSK